MDSISSVDTHLTISFNAHCLETRVSSILEAAWLTILRFALTDQQPKSLWLSRPQRSILLSDHPSSLFLNCSPCLADQSQKEVWFSGHVPFQGQSLTSP